MGFILTNNNRPLTTRIVTETFALTFNDNNASIYVDSPINCLAIVGDFLPPGFNCYIIQKGNGMVTVIGDGAATIKTKTKATTSSPEDWLKIISNEPKVYSVLSGGGIVGNTNGTIGAYKLFNLEFRGLAGNGAIGPYTLPPLTVPYGTIIDEIYFDAFPILDRTATPPGLTAGAGAYITFGIETDGPDCALDSESGLVETLNENRITKIMDPNPVKALEDRLLVMAVGGAVISSGQATIIIKTLNFEL